MCGIVGAVAQEDIVPYLITGLLKLEYRGYDSAGVAVVGGGDNGANSAASLRRLRTTGRVAELQKLVESEKFSGNTGIAHTRWATHGIPSERNAHPHFSGDIAVVHNGIIENHESLRQELQAQGYVFDSDTDTEVIAHLITFNLQQSADLFLAVQAAVSKLKGAYAIAVVSKTQPDRVVVARNGAPLLLGLADNGHYAASDAMALLQVTRKMIYLEEGDIAELQQHSYRIVDRTGKVVTRPAHVSELSGEAVEKGPYAHFMQKEIFEQPGAVANTLEVVANAHTFTPQLFAAELGKAEAIFKRTEKVLILACGTSYHAGLTARYWLEAIAGVPCSVEIASEYRYRLPAPAANTLVLTISQSGETADTLAALEYAKSLGHQHNMAICNAPESALVRQSELRFLTRAGPEIGVASTKAFTTQLTALMLLTLTLAKVRGKLTDEKEQEMLRALRHLPVALQHALAVEPQVKIWAERFAQKRHALFLGRGMHYPIAMEGALKLKEISYIHAEAYAAGELKHGPLALVDKDMPVVAIAPNDALLEKLKSNLQEVRARGGELYVFADADSHIQQSEGVHVIRLAEHAGLLSPILHTIPLQLLAYHVALQKGTDVDKPRNLAKSVTVE